MNTLSRFWTAIHTPPPAHAAVEVRFADGSSSLVIWNGSPTLAGHPTRNAVAWRLVPELDDLETDVS
ncbi:MAG: hypothetical protein IAE82_12890 [Opitutaceae bacterium]|nr:hypothetical protein [Opitutaceae bacterium]